MFRRDVAGRGTLTTIRTSVGLKFMNRETVHKIYRIMQSHLAPGLKYSQTLYEKVLCEYCRRYLSKTKGRVCVALWIEIDDSIAL